MSMLFAYIPGGEGVCVCGGGLEVLKCFVRVGQNFSTCFVCVCGGGGGGVGGVRFSTSSSVKKITDPPPHNVLGPRRLAYSFLCAKKQLFIYFHFFIHFRLNFFVQQFTL